MIKVYDISRVLIGDFDPNITTSCLLKKLGQGSLVNSLEKEDAITYLDHEIVPAGVYYFIKAPPPPPAVPGTHWRDHMDGLGLTDDEMVDAISMLLELPEQDRDIWVDVNPEVSRWVLRARLSKWRKAAKFGSDGSDNNMEFGDQSPPELYGRADDPSSRLQLKSFIGSSDDADVWDLENSQVCKYYADDLSDHRFQREVSPARHQGRCQHQPGGGQHQDVAGAHQLQ
mmetsp:Transcript_16648/g.36017  ORF Transcript_16648/g.36017 Transcript_16648/m.36017 type:complete len:228 (+) Transcript_16648:3-686(+)